MKANIPYIIIIVALAMLLLAQRSCSRPIQPEQPTITVISDTQYVTKDSLITEYVPYKVTVEVPVEVPVNVDTQAILKDYYLKKVFIDTIRLDSVGYVAITDTVYKNSITSRSPYYNYKIPVVTNRVIIDNPPKKVFKLFTGLETQVLLRGSIQSVGANVILNTKSDNIYNVGTGYNFNVNAPYIKIGTAWKVRIK